MSYSNSDVADAPSSTSAASVVRTRARYSIAAMLFLITTVNFADRATLSVVGTFMQKELGMDAVTMGYMFSAFAWAYVLGQVPGGWLLDRLGSRKTYCLSLVLWSFFTLCQAFIGFFGAAAIGALFVFRFIVGLAESPAFPANSRIAAAWFPTAERGKVAAAFTSSVYFSSVIFLPIMAWIVSTYNWHAVFVVMGVLGMLLGAIWLKIVHNPKDSPYANAAEVEFIAQGGGLVDMDQAGRAPSKVNTLACLKELLSNRMLVGVYIGQYCITTLTYFFLTWFPIYLVQDRGMTILKAGFIASVPALAGFIGGLLGGSISDWLLKRGHSLTFARKLPLVIGMLLSMLMVLCNYTSVEWVVVALMGVAFFGKGMGAMGWVVVADTSPKEALGLSGGLFNTFGNTAGITTPIIIGYLVSSSGSFNGALLFVAANAAVALLSYLVIVGPIKRVELKASLRSE